MWEENLDSKSRLARITTAQIEDVKIRRAQKVSHSTVDKNLAALRAFFNWCIGRNLATSNPVRGVKLFHEELALRYLSREEYDRLLTVAGTIETSPYLEEKIILAVHYRRPSCPAEVGLLDPPKLPNLRAKKQGKGNVHQGAINGRRRS